MHELILGGQRSGKSRRAEQHAAAWLAVPGREALLVATALGADDEMRARIERHRADRRERVPGLQTMEAPRGLGDALRLQSRADRLLVVDCLTLWLTQLMLPAEGAPASDRVREAEIDGLLQALRERRGPVVLVSNEIGLGVAPLSAEGRRFIDTLGQVHQAVAALCDRVTLMVAGLPLAVREPSRPASP